MEPRLITLGEKIHDALVEASLKGVGKYSRNLAGACAVGSFLLVQEAKRWFGMDVKFTATSGHAWTEYRGEVYDITATQFSREEKVFNIQKSMLDTFTDDMLGFYYLSKHSKTLKEINNEWPDYQRPENYQVKWIFHHKAHIIYLKG
jgi:hypothetical protein